MSKRAIVLADGRRISLGAYVKAWKACLSLPGETWIGRGVDGYGQTAAQALSDLRAGMHDRINRHIPAYGLGRKWSHDWQRQTLQAAAQINTPRLVIRWLPPDLLKRAELRERVEYGKSI